MAVNCNIDCLKNLISRILAKPNVINAICSSEDELNALLSTVDYCKQKEQESNYQYRIYTPIDKDYGIFEIVDGKFHWKDRVGTILSYYWNSHLVHSPRDIKYHLSGKIIISNYFGNPFVIFDADWSLMYRVGISGTPSSVTDNLVRYGYSADFDDTGNTVFTVLYYDRMIKMFDLTNANSPNGINVSSGNPVSVSFVPGQNKIIVATRNGGQGDLGRVYSYDFDPTSFSLSNETVLLEYNGNGTPWTLEVRRPKVVRVYQNPDTSDYELWVVYEVDYVARFKYDPASNSLELIRSYSKTPGMDANNVNVSSIAVDYSQGIFYSTISGAQVIAILGLETGNLLGYIGEIGYENWAGNPNTPGKFNSLSGIEIIPSTLDPSRKYVVVADYGNNRVQQFPLEIFDPTPIEIELTTKNPITFKHIDFVSEKYFDPEKEKCIIRLAQLLAYTFPEKVIVAGEIE